MAAATPALKIVGIERTTVRVPFRQVPARNMDREIPHWRYSEICEVELAGGTRGFGESLIFYSWGATQDEAVDRALGKNAANILWDDSLGAGLQMALFDAVARHLEVPVHALLGEKVHDRTPLAWWNIDTNVEDWVSECKTAYEQGYRAYKTKGRPWYDVWAQVEETAKALPEDFHVAVDFNDTLLTAEQGIPILRDLAKYPQVAIFESPIFQEDLVGNRKIRKATPVPVAMHYDRPEPELVIRTDACDGFVCSGGASELRAMNAVATMAGMPFWLQLVGTDVTAAWSLHNGGVFESATWPAVNCHQLFETGLLTKPIVVKEGYAEVPDGIGLGFELNRDAIEQYRVEKPPERPEPERLIRTIWPDGRVMYTANDGTVNFMLNAARDARMPYFERGVDTDLVPDDGSGRWRELYQKARTEGPVLTK